MENYNMILTVNQQKCQHYGKINKDEYLTGKKILPPGQKRVVEQAKFTYFPLGKAFKQIKLNIKEKNK